MPVTKTEVVSEREDFNCAGAKFTATEGAIAGTFHPIPRPLWQAIVGFHRQASINWAAETVSYHKWNDAAQAYHTIIPWQNTSKHGLHIDLSWTEKANAALLDEYAKKYGEDFFPACTIHTHVDTGAFESGTDAKDEAANPGWHITLGHLVSHPRYDLDVRMRVPVVRRLKALINTSNGIKLTWKHVFADSAGIQDFVHSVPGTCDWHEHLTRINPK